MLAIPALSPLDIRLSKRGPIIFPSILFWVVVSFSLFLSFFLSFLIFCFSRSCLLRPRFLLSSRARCSMILRMPQTSRMPDISIHRNGNGTISKKLRIVQCSLLENTKPNDAQKTGFRCRGCRRCYGFRLRSFFFSA